ncbi:c-type cytochrome [Aestuariibius insulae]|uniref:c-type cytochrome n=1 Tax=Aestuariibius insulae TaxID=2058287 RepID=UPI00345F09C1
MRRLVLIGTGGLALAAAAALLLRPAGAEGVRLAPGDVAVVAQGAEVYAVECAACHGASLEGQPDWRSPGPDGLRPAPPHDASGHTWHHDDATLFALTKHGLAGLMEDAPPSGMPAYEGVLTDDEIVAVLSYIKSTWPDDVRARHDAINDRARP